MFYLKAHIRETGQGKKLRNEVWYDNKENGSPICVVHALRSEKHQKSPVPDVGKQDPDRLMLCVIVNSYVSFLCLIIALN